MTYRSRALLDLAHDMPCMFKYPHACTGQTVPCHSNWQAWGRGTGHKAPDWAFAAGCATANQETAPHIGAKMDREQMKTEWLIAYVRTQDWLWTHGYLVVNRKGRIAA